MNSRLKRWFSVALLLLAFAMLFVKTNIETSEKLERLESKIDSMGEVKYRTLAL